MEALKQQVRERVAGDRRPEGKQREGNPAKPPASNKQKRDPRKRKQEHAGIVLAVVERQKGEDGGCRQGKEVSVRGGTSANHRNSPEHRKDRTDTE